MEWIEIQLFSHLIQPNWIRDQKSLIDLVFFLK